MKDNREFLRELKDIAEPLMDRERIVISHLDNMLPMGKVLDVGAGNGFTAGLLTRPGRLIVPLEPAFEMIETKNSYPWVQAVAQELPFRSGTLDGAYATWAYFFSANGFQGDEGLAELQRVVVPDGEIVIVDNMGDDEFNSFSQTPHTSDPLLWLERGFSLEMLTTSFRFDSIAESQELLTFYFGEQARNKARLEIEFRVAVYSAESRCVDRDC